MGNSQTTSYFIENNSIIYFPDLSPKEKTCIMLNKIVWIKKDYNKVILSLVNKENKIIDFGIEYPIAKDCFDELQEVLNKSKNN